MAATMIGIRTRQPRSASRNLGTEIADTLAQHILKMLQ